MEQREQSRMAEIPEGKSFNLLEPALRMREVERRVLSCFNLGKGRFPSINVAQFDGPYKNMFSC